MDMYLKLSIYPMNIKLANISSGFYPTCKTNVFNNDLGLVVVHCGTYLHWCSSKYLQQQEVYVGLSQNKPVHLNEGSCHQIFRIYEITLLL